MAKLIPNNYEYNNSTSTVIKRVNPFPLDMYEVFLSYNTAYNYAYNSPVSFVGQEISVVEYDNVNTTYITNRAVITYNTNGNVLDPIVTVGTAWEEYTAPTE